MSATAVPRYRCVATATQHNSGACPLVAHAGARAGGAGHTQQGVWDVIVMAAIAAMETGVAAMLQRRGD